MTKHIMELGPREAEFLSLMSSSGSWHFNITQATHYWGKPNRAWRKLFELERKGWIARIERGKYQVIPLEAGPKREWSEDSALIAGLLVEPAAIAYWSALRHWNWTEQIPRVVYVQTTTRKSRTKHSIFGVDYRIVKVPKPKFYGNVKEWVAGKPVFITGKEKTLVDCSSDPKRAGSVEELAKAVKEATKEISWKLLDEYVNRYPNGAAKKRLGYLLETLVPRLSEEGRRALAGWQRDLSEGYVPLLPSKTLKGKFVHRWRVVVNVEI